MALKFFRMDIELPVYLSYSQEQQRLRKDLEDEKRARKRLETLLRKSVRSLIEPPSNLDHVHENANPSAS